MNNKDKNNNKKTFNKFNNIFYKREALTNNFFSAGFMNQKLEDDFKVKKYKIFKYELPCLVVFILIYLGVSIASIYQRYTNPSLFVIVVALFTFFYLVFCGLIFITKPKTKLNLYSRFASYFTLIFCFIFIQIYHAVEVKILTKIPVTTVAQLVDITAIQYRTILAHSSILLIKLYYLINPSFAMTGGTFLSLLVVRVFSTIYNNYYFSAFVLEVVVLTLCLFCYFFIFVKFNRYLRRAFVYDKQKDISTNHFLNLVDELNSTNQQYVSFTKNEVITYNKQFLLKLKAFQIQILESKINNNIDEQFTEKVIIPKEDFFSSPTSVLDYLNTYKLTKIINDYDNPEKLNSINNEYKDNYTQDLQLSKKILKNNINNIFDISYLLAVEYNEDGTIINDDVKDEREEEDSEIKDNRIKLKKIENYVSFKTTSKFKKIGYFINQSKDYIISYRKVKLLEKVSFVFDFLIDEITDNMKSSNNESKAVEDLTKRNQNIGIKYMNEVKNPLKSLIYSIYEISDDLKSNAKSAELLKRIKKIETVAEYLSNEITEIDDYMLDGKRNFDINIEALSTNQIINYINSYLMQTKAKFDFNFEKSRQKFNFTIDTNEFDSTLIMTDRFKILQVISIILNCLSTKLTSGSNTIDINLNTDFSTRSTSNLSIQARGIDLKNLNVLNQFETSDEIIFCKNILNKLKHKIIFRRGYGIDNLIIEIKFLDVQALIKNDQQTQKSERNRNNDFQKEKSVFLAKKELEIMSEDEDKLPFIKLIKSKQQELLNNLSPNVNYKLELKEQPNNNIQFALNKMSFNAENQKDTKNKQILVITEDTNELTSIYDLINQNEEYKAFSIIPCIDSTKLLDLLKSSNQLEIIICGEKINSLEQTELIKGITSFLSIDNYPKPYIICLSMNKDDYLSLLSSGVDFILKKAISKEEIIRIMTLYKIKVASKIL